jgi:hypothetical protein
VAKKITNTATQLSDNPLENFFRASTMGQSGAIEVQEARGQAELVESEQIPTDLRDVDEDGLRALGFELGEVCVDDPIFRVAKLPPGWKKVATDHSMWSTIVDAEGKERFGVFYKAAFYDRSAFMSATL